MQWEGVERRKINELMETEASKISFMIRAMSDVPPSHQNLCFLILPVYLDLGGVSGHSLK